MRSLILFTGLSVAFLAPASAAVCAPKHLVRVVVANATPGIDRSSFAAQPKIYYRIGSDKLRVEEGVDAANGIHGVMVIAEPNIWLANLYDGTGKHGIDPGPTFYARAPLFGTNLRGKLIGLEFGCEADFVAANAPKPVRNEDVNGVNFNVYRIEDGQDAVEILEKAGTNVPVFARLFQQGNPTTVLRYDLYETNLPDNPSLFVPPADVKYTHASL